jgi:branched-chain amino acid aminotransferase
MCGTAAEVVPVVSVDGRLIGSGPGALTSRLAEAYDRLVRTTGTAIHAEAVASAN